jgi:uncharacterized protein YndB with AHSA1/START domain
MDNMELTPLPDIHKTLVLDFPIDMVWEAIATSDGIAGWFLPNDFQPEEGRSFYMDTTPMPMGITPCKVIQVEYPHRLSYEWGKDWELTFELKESGDQTEMNVIHTGWTAGKITDFGMSHSEIHQHMLNSWTILTNRLIRRVLAKIKK